MALERYFIQEGVIRSKIESFLRKELNRAGYSGINIQKTPLSTRVILFVEKPPLVIGKKGRRINKLTQMLSEKYGLDNPSIDVQKIEEPMLDPNIIARRIAVALERGINRRRVVYRALRAVMGCNARGVEIVLSGKIVGKGGRSRQEKYFEGYMKKAGDSVKLVSIGSTQAFLKAGVIGVTVKIVPPGVIFPDQIFLKTEEEEKEAVYEKPVDVAAEKPEDKSKVKKKSVAKPEDRPKAEKEPAKEKSEAKKPSKKKEEKPKAEKEASENAKEEKTDLPKDQRKLILREEKKEDKPSTKTEAKAEKPAAKKEKSSASQVDKKPVKEKEARPAKKNVDKKASDKKEEKDVS